MKVSDRNKKKVNTATAKRPRLKGNPATAKQRSLMDHLNRLVVDKGSPEPEKKVARDLLSKLRRETGEDQENKIKHLYEIPEQEIADGFLLHCNKIAEILGIKGSAVISSVFSKADKTKIELCAGIVTKRGATISFVSRGPTTEPAGYIQLAYIPAQEESFLGLVVLGQFEWTIDGCKLSKDAVESSKNRLNKLIEEIKKNRLISK